MERSRCVKLFLNDAERAALRRVAANNKTTIQGVLRELVAAVDRGDVALDPKKFDASSRLAQEIVEPNLFDEVRQAQRVFAALLDTESKVTH